MKYRINNSVYFIHVKGETLYSDPFIKNYLNFLILIKKSYGTQENYIKAIHRFWIYTIYIPIKKYETLLEYLRKYIEKLKNGFSLYEMRYMPTVNSDFKFEVFRSKALHSPSSISVELAAIQSYLEYINDPSVNPHYDKVKDFSKDIGVGKIDKNYEAMKTKHSVHSGFGLIKRGIVEEIFSKRVSIFKYLYPNKREFYSNIQKPTIFPSKAFEALLKKAKDREKLLYLLCGGASVRIGQALNLTIYDVDVENEIVYIVDPRSNSNVSVYSKDKIKKTGGRYKFFKQQYSIDLYKKPHILIRNKGLIPCSKDQSRELYFVLEQYKKMFFDTYSKIVKNRAPESTMKIPHPFIFQTSTGNRYTYSSASKIFSSNVKKIFSKDLGFNDREEYTLHSLRHMYGSMMASIAVIIEKIITKERKNFDVRNINNYYNWKVFTSRKMGHENIASVDVYFNEEQRMENKFLELVKSNQEYIEEMFNKSSLGD